ncbi:hypothetical protein NL518_29315, partial [Klebsiella pneumoniae]|nr:hypothetical protein [Klebsiella pneumoniae]
PFKVFPIGSNTHKATFLLALERPREGILWYSFQFMQRIFFYSLNQYKTMLSERQLEFWK